MPGAHKIGAAISGPRITAENYGHEAFSEKLSWGCFIEKSGNPKKRGVIWVSPTSDNSTCWGDHLRPRMRCLQTTADFLSFPPPQCPWLSGFVCLLPSEEIPCIIPSARPAVLLKPSPGQSYTSIIVGELIV